jgi:hypothetical protein
MAELTIVDENRRQPHQGAVVVALLLGAIGLRNEAGQRNGDHNHYFSDRLLADQRRLFQERWGEMCALLQAA